MAWMQQRDAVAVLGVSQRTLTRRIARDELETKRDGANVLVWVDDDGPVDTVVKVGGQLAKVAAADAVQRTRDLEMMTATIGALERAADRATMAERRAINTTRGAVAVTATVSMLAVVAIAWGGWTFYETTREHDQTVFSMQSEHTATVANMAATMLNTESERDETRKRANAAETDREWLRDRLAVVETERDRARIERDRAVAMARAVQFIDTVVGVFHPDPPGDVPRGGDDVVVAANP